MQALISSSDEERPEAYQSILPDEESTLISEA